MDRFVGRTALVTGGGSGIGLSVTEKLLHHGINVVACARNVEPIKQLAIQTNFKGKLHPYKCDLRQDTEVEEMFKWIESKLKTGVDICINNAGYSGGKSLLEVTPTEMRDMFNTNVVALLYCSQLAIKSMLQRNINDGHIINLNSLLGHTVLGVLNFYASTKFAVTALTQGLKKELIEKGLRIKVSSISPGRTETQFLHTAFGQDKGNKIYSSMENLRAEDVANSIIHVLTTPPHVQISEILIEPIQPTPKGAYD